MEVVFSLITDLNYEHDRIKLCRIRFRGNTVKLTCHPVRPFCHLLCTPLPVLNAGPPSHCRERGTHPRDGSGRGGMAAALCSHTGQGLPLDLQTGIQPLCSMSCFEDIQGKGKHVMNNVMNYAMKYS